MKMRKFRCGSAVALALACFALQPVQAENWQDDGKTFGKLLSAAQRSEWSRASRLAQEISLPVAGTVVEWLRLRSGAGEFQDYLEFLENHGDWPGLKILRKAGEQAMTEDTDPLLVAEYFRIQPPQSGHGAIRFAEALHRLGLHDDAGSAIKDGWKSLPFTEAEQTAALELFGDALAAENSVRFDNLLWEKRHDEAESLFPLLDEGHRRLGEARIALQNRSNGVDSRIRLIPGSLQNDPGLSYDRVVWRLIEGAEESALSLFLEVSSSHAHLGRPELWAQRRLSLAHWLMREGRYQESYRIASSHHLTDNGLLPPLMSVSEALRERAERTRLRNYADLEWISGYLQLRFLDDPARAIQHFSAFRRAVDTPISIGRAGYWLGLAYENAGQTELAAEAYASAALEQTTFYGQLAAERLGAATKPALAVPGMGPRPNSGNLLRIPVVQAGLLYRYAGHDPHSAWFLAHVAETLNEADSHALAALAFEHGALFSSVKVAKEGVKNGHSDIVHLFPLVGISEYDLPVPHEVALSVARQETEFRDTAVSGRGAVGFMQIKPSTGKELAEQIGLKGRIDRLLRQRRHNVLLGSQYLRDRMDEYGGSYIMAFAAYNAGPARLQGWLPVIGDPRTGQIDPVDWIEHIPYGETRNYVMRVMEALTVYRMRLEGEPRPITLLNDLARGLPGWTQRAASTM